jgi:heterokaryon incompatibility protein (HET)
MQSFSLAQVPKYITLSYTWGEHYDIATWVNFEDSQKHVILVDGHYFKIGHNLFGFMNTFRKSSYNHGLTHQGRYYLACRWLWIDQICINQQDNKEKTHQVKLMTDIYSQSQLTIAWLGMQWHSRLEKHNYFKRIWVFQELILSKNILLLRGDGSSMTWKEYAEDGCPELDPDVESWLDFDFDPVTALARARLKYSKLAHKSTGQAGFHLYDITSSFVFLQSTDPKDRIYGFMGLVKERERLDVDYSKTVQEVFLEAAVVMLNKSAPGIRDPRAMHIASVGLAMGVVSGQPITYDELTELSSEENLATFLCLVDRLLADLVFMYPTEHQQITALGFQKVAGNRSAPRWAVDKDWKGCLGKWWFSYRGNRYCFVGEDGCRLTRPSGFLAQWISSHDLGSHIVCYLPDM